MILETNNMEIEFNSDHPKLELTESYRDDVDYQLMVVPNISFKIHINNKYYSYKIISIFMDGINIFDDSITIDKMEKNSYDNDLLSGYGVIKPEDKVVVDGFKKGDDYYSFVINDDINRSEAAYILGKDSKHLGYIDIITKNAEKIEHKEGLIDKKDSSGRRVLGFQYTVNSGKKITYGQYERMKLLSDLPPKMKLELNNKKRVRISLRLA